MSDEELIHALTEFCRRVGLLDEARRLALEDVPMPRDDALCLAFGTYGEVRLCCTYGKEHSGLHSWERAMIGKSACIAATRIGAFGEWLCQRPSGHAGEHKASTPDGARWTWGDAPRDEDTGELGKGCGAWEWGTNGHKAGCILRAGHEGAHRGVDADGKSIFTWPCPCYPDCTGHAVPGVPNVKGTVDWSTVRLTTDSPELRCGAKNASQNPVMAGQVCALLRGHEGGHEAIVNGQRWLFGRTDPTDPTEPRA